MKTEIEHISEVKKKILVEVDSAEIQKELDQAYRELSKNIMIPGFRRGKVPRGILVRRFGKSVNEEVTRNIISKTLPKAIEDIELDPITLPVVENELIKEGQDFKYSAVVEVRPSIELGDYKGIEVKREEVEVSEEELKGELENLRQNYGTLIAVKNRGVSRGDYVIIEYEGFEDEKPVEGLRHRGYMAKIGNGTLPEEMEEGLLGLEKGQEKEIVVKFPEDHINTQIAGKEIRFRVRLLDIRDLKLPELNDEFAKSIDKDLKGLEDLKQRLKEELLARKEAKRDQELRLQLLEKISESVNFPLPESLVEQRLKFEIERYRTDLQASGTILKKEELNEKRLKEKFRPLCERYVKHTLIIEEIAKREGIRVTEEDMDKEFRRLAERSGKTPEVVRRSYQSEGLMDMLRDRLFREKVLDFLFKNAKVIPSLSSE